MKMQLVGRRHCSGSFNGNSWEHIKLYVVHKDSLKGLEGFVAESLKVPVSMNLDGINVNDNIDVQFNRYGNVSSVVKL